MRSLRGILGVAVAGALFLVACGGQGPSETRTESASPGAASTVPPVPIPKEVPGQRLRYFDVRDLLSAFPDGGEGLVEALTPFAADAELVVKNGTLIARAKTADLDAIGQWLEARRPAELR